jgi:hypothetical protein
VDTGPQSIKLKLVLQVALALNMKVYVEQDKWNVLRCLDMRVRERQLLTRNMNEAGIHVVPMRMVCSSLQHYKQPIELS